MVTEIGWRTFLFLKAAVRILHPEDFILIDP